MNFEYLQEVIHDGTTMATWDALRIALMVEEVRLLPDLQQRYQAETNERLKKGIANAGKRLSALRSSGTDTLEEIYNEFGVYREIKALTEQFIVERKRHLVNTVY